MYTEGDITNEFYNLKGAHINKRKENFYKLLKTSANPTLLSVKPRNFLEKIFYLDILIYYRKTDKLLEILQEGNGVFTSKILKEKWFFQEVFQQKNEADIVNNFLPSLSCSLRGKVLLKMAVSLTEEKMDKIIELVIQRYGISLAQQILFGCSEEMIKKIINNYYIDLDSVHLKRLLKKNPLLIKFYFEKYAEFQGKEYNDNDFLKYLCWKKPELYFDMGLNSRLFVKLGKCTTKTLLKIKEKDVMNNVKLYSDILHLGQLAKQVIDFDKLYLPKILPKNLGEFKQRSTQKLLRKILIKYPCNKRWNIISNVFALTYNKNIMEYLDYFQPDVLRLFNVEIMHQWANLMYSKTSDTKYWTHMDPEEVFKLTKAKINVTSTVSHRIGFLTQLINICHVNIDYNTYGEVLKYITQRHRNDDLNRILESVNSNYNPINFTDFHWKYIGEILEIVRAKGNIIHSRIILDYLQYLSKHEIPSDDTFKWFISDSIKHSLDFKFNIKGQLEDWEKMWRKSVEVAIEMEMKKCALSKIINLIVIFNTVNKHFSIDLTQYEAVIELMQNTCQLKEHYDDYDFQIIVDFLTYNSQKPSTLIRVCDDDQLVAVVKVLSQQYRDNHVLINIVSDIVSKQNRTNFEMKLLHYFVTEWFDKIPRYNGKKRKVLKYLIKNDPEIANSYFSLLLKYNTEYNIFDLDLLRKYSHLEFDEKFIKYHSETLSTNISSSNIKILEGLVLFMSSDNFLDLISQYLPKNTKIDIKDFRNTYQLQCEIIRLFQKIEEPVKVLPYISRVCREDYLQNSLPTMYNILNRVSENAAHNFIDTLKDQPVSLRKHSVFLAFNYLPLHLAIEVYMSVSSKEKNISMKKHFLTAILKIFMKNPLKSIMDIVVTKLDTLNKDDDELLQTLIESVDTMPNRFRAAYIETLWRKLDTFAVDANDTFADYGNKYRYAIIHKTRLYFRKVEFSEVFCSDIIRTYFLSSVGGTRFSNDINEIVMDYLLSNDSQRFDFVFKIVAEFKESKWRCQKEDPKQCLPISILDDFFRVSLYKLNTYDTNVLLQFEAYWKRVFSFTEDFSGFCSLELLKLYKAADRDIRIFAEGIDCFFQNVILTYGPYVNPLLIKCLRSFCHLENKKISDHLLEDLTVDLLTINASSLNHFIGMDVALNASDNEKKSQIVQLLSRQNEQLAEILSNTLLLRIS